MTTQEDPERLAIAAGYLSGALPGLAGVHPETILRALTEAMTPCDSLAYPHEATPPEPTEAYTLWAKSRCPRGAKCGGYECEAAGDHNSGNGPAPGVQWPEPTVSDGEREGLLAVLTQKEHGPDECHDPRDGTCQSCPWPLHELPPEQIADALLAAGYRLAPTLNGYSQKSLRAVRVEDVLAVADAITARSSIGVYRGLSDNTRGIANHAAREAATAVLALLEGGGRG